MQAALKLKQQQGQSMRQQQQVAGLQRDVIGWEREGVTSDWSHAVVEKGQVL